MFSQKHILNTYREELFFKIKYTTGWNCLVQRHKVLRKPELSGLYVNRQLTDKIEDTQDEWQINNEYSL